MVTKMVTTCFTDKLEKRLIITFDIGKGTIPPGLKI